MDERAQESAGEIPLGQGEKVLLVEDDPDVRVLSRRMLTELGYKVREVGDAAAAREALARETPDLVLSDVVLPGGTSGPELAEEIKAVHSDMKVLFMSGYARDSMRGSNADALKHTLLAKPFRRHALAGALRAALTPEKARQRPVVTPGTSGDRPGG